MEGIIIWNGLGEESYIKAWLKFGRDEAHFTDHTKTEWSGPYDTEVFLNAGPKLLIQW